MEKVSSSSSITQMMTSAESYLRDQAILEFQNRLVLLHHAANCPFSNGTAPKTCRGFPSCFEMVQLLKHVNNCELLDCAVPHCVSTRYLLTHSKTCVKEECIICKPLKESIKRKNERSRQVVTVEKRKRELSPLTSPQSASLGEENRRQNIIEVKRKKVDLSTADYRIVADSIFAEDFLSTCHVCAPPPDDDFSIFEDLLLEDEKESITHCFRCLSQIWKGYRYYCPQCDVNLCMGCFHFNRGDQLPHEHPVIPKRVYQINHSVLRPSLSSASLSSHTSNEG